MGVAKWGRECGSRMGVAKWGREWESRMGVAKWGREGESRKWVAKIKKYRGVCKGDPEGSNYLIKNSTKIGSAGNIGPGRLGPFFKRSVP